MEGHLTKRGRIVKNWKRRYFELRGTTMIYRTDKGLKIKGRMEIKDGKVDNLGTFKSMENVGRLKTPSRTLYFSADSTAKLNAWLGAINIATGVSGPVPPPLAPLSITASSPSSSSSSPSPSPFAETPKALPPLPDTLRIIGAPEVGNTFQLYAQPGIDVLNYMDLQWFRCSPDADLHALVASPSRIGSDDSSSLIDDQVIQTYTAQAFDIGSYVGCICRHPEKSDRALVGLSSLPIQDVPTDTVTPSLHIVEHVHHKYCDRRVRVCTSMDRHRQGEICELKLRGPADQFSNYKVVWYRSVHPVIGTRRPTPPADSDSDDGFPPSSPASSSAGAGAGAGAGTGAGASSSSSASASSTPSASPTSNLPGNRLDLEAIEYERVAPRPLSHMPPAPPDAAKSPTYAEITAPLPEPPAPPVGGFTQYPLFLQDVHHVIRCGLIPADDDPDSCTDVIFSFPIGPIEPAPPNAREVFIEGEPLEGSLLKGRVYYFGGYEGPSRAWWIRITPDGDSEHISHPTEVEPLGLDDHIEEGDPRVYRLSEFDIGAYIKFKYQPVRDDYEEGHLMTSRPTKPIKAAASASASSDTTAAAAAAVATGESLRVDTQ